MKTRPSIVTLRSGKPVSYFRRTVVYGDEANQIIERLERKVERLEMTLTKIAAFSDSAASERLKTTGSYSSFDEPGSVQIARHALAASNP